eukprot:CAMPEP_0117027812 /NCGR_PEP_ID=MMETSP0472-20121206/20285_1 /TAXON_ID=693140 ORGANISM="Tiarina fusus, Strain LIS" /NCGR_SAMPLE_ID=MMETSP0472 /ASSEMBLY_ACC=CAM_ASM_000603 /LENGTH=86 /DNA_ID=CAMNT_0004735141 /DNA_START=914 /DNA_END=1174 /DNA_ORIENTATION=+
MNSLRQIQVQKPLWKFVGLVADEIGDDEFSNEFSELSDDELPTIAQYNTLWDDEEEETDELYIVPPEFIEKPGFPKNKLFDDDFFD